MGKPSRGLTTKRLGAAVRRDAENLCLQPRCLYRVLGALLWSGTFCDGHKVANGGASVNLSWSIDAAGGIVSLFTPVGQPAWQSSDSEHHSEHVGGNPHRSVEQSTVEVHIGVEFSADEVVVFEGDFFEVPSNFQQRIINAQFVEHLFGHFPENCGTWVKVFVNAVTEAHEAEVTGFVLGHHDVFFVIAPVVVNHLQHFENCLVRTAVQWSPEGADAGRDGGKNIGAAAGDNSHGGSAAVLLVICVQNQEHVQGLHEDRIDFVIFRRDRKHHVQEVRTVGQIVFGINLGLSDGFLVGIGGDCSHFGQQPDNVDVGIIVFSSRVVSGQ